jgi:DNA-directed RNA polymerase specialized sigma24 family protein
MPLADDVQGKAILRDADDYEAMTLQRCCVMHRPLPLDRVIAVGLNILPSLHALHEAGFIHRDVKPPNVVLIGGLWKLCDMGLVARRDQIAGNSGTPWFMPPEGVKDRRADLYAFGKTLFLLATDYPPARFPDFITGGLPVPGTDDRCPGLHALVQKACQNEPSQRFQTALEMYQAINRLVRPTKLTIVLDDDFASFTPEKLEEFIGAVRGKGFGVRGVPTCEAGTVRITLELMPDEAERLAAAVRAGEFVRFHAVRAEFTQSPATRASATPTLPGGEGSVTHLIAKLKAGDREAVQRLWESYFDRLVRLARKLLRSAPRRAADEEDVALSTFASFCREAEQGKFPQLVDRNNLWRLLVVSTARKARGLSQHERRQRRDGPRVTTGSEEPPSVEDVIGHEPTPEFAAQMVESYQQLLDRLPDPVLRSIAQWKMEGYTNDEIAAKLGCAPRTVERKLRVIRGHWAQEL